MTNETINNLHPAFDRVNHIRTIERCSRSDENREGMVDSDIKVIWFDKFSDSYGHFLSLSKPKSNDALYISDEDEWCFVEFKSGIIQKDDIYRKIYDSLNALIELGIIDGLRTARKKIEYILVYNRDKYSKSESLNRIGKNLFEKANIEERLFEIDKFIGYLFRDAHTYNVDEFKNAITDWV